MIDAQGTVTELDGGYAVVRMDEAGCGRCHEKGGCGGANIGTMLCTTPRTFRVLNPDQAAVGDQVQVVIAAGVLRRSAAYAYGLPLLALFGGALLGSALAGEPGAIIGAVSGLIASALVLRYFLRRYRQDKRFDAFIRT